MNLTRRQFLVNMGIWGGMALVPFPLPKRKPEPDFYDADAYYRARSCSVNGIYGADAQGELDAVIRLKDIDRMMELNKNNPNVITKYILPNGQEHYCVK